MDKALERETGVRFPHPTIVILLHYCIVEVTEMKYIKKVKDFVVDVAKATVRKVKEFVVGLYRHAEAVVMMVGASWGFSTLLAELPFWATLPFWVESAVVIPVISVLLVLALCKIMEIRGRKRMAMA